MRLTRKRTPKPAEPAEPAEPAKPELTPDERMEIHTATYAKRQSDARYRAHPAFLAYLLHGCQEGEDAQFIPFGDAGYDPGGSGMYSMQWDAANRKLHPEWYEELTEDDELQPVVPPRPPWPPRPTTKNDYIPTPEERQAMADYESGMRAECERLVDYAVQFAEQMAYFIEYANDRPGLPSHWMQRIAEGITSLAMAHASGEGREDARRSDLWMEALKDKYPDTYRRTT